MKCFNNTLILESSVNKNKLLPYNYNSTFFFKTTDALLFLNDVYLDIIFLLYNDTD
jgi:hypothetical protein